VQVFVRDNNVDQALKALKRKMQREGVFREMRLRGHYEKPSERRVRERAEAIRRARKLARKKLQREGLLPTKPRVAPGAPGTGGPARKPRFWFGRFVHEPLSLETPIGDEEDCRLGDLIDDKEAILPDRGQGAPEAEASKTIEGA
jgi:small subunit ribosomal protein S21